MLVIFVTIMSSSNALSTYYIKTIAGQYSVTGFSGDGAAATLSTMNIPTGIFVGDGGNIYFTDKNNNRVRRIISDGTISTSIGNGAQNSAGNDGRGTSAGLIKPHGIWRSVQNIIYITESTGINQLIPQYFNMFNTIEMQGIKSDRLT
jgi:hypothetical protein